MTSPTDPTGDACAVCGGAVVVGMDEASDGSLHGDPHCPDCGWSPLDSPESTALVKIKRAVENEGRFPSREQCRWMLERIEALECNEINLQIISTRAAQVSEAMTEAVKIKAVVQDRETTERAKAIDMINHLWTDLVGVIEQASKARR